MRFFLTLVLLLAPPAFAQIPACQSDLDRLCGASPTAPEKFKCLLAKEAELSTDCKQAIQRFVQERRQSFTRGGGALGSFGGMGGVAPAFPLISFDGRYAPSKTGAPSLNDYRFNFSAPVAKADQNLLSVSLASGLLHFGDPIVLTSGAVVSQNLYRLELGGQFLRRLPEKRFWMSRASIGIVSDKTFDNLKDLAYSLVVGYGFPGSEKSSWILSIFIANNSPIANFIPLPGFLYSYRGEEFSGTFGFPIISMQWTPVSPWVYSLSFFGPNVTAEISRGDPESAQPFIGFNWFQQRYIPSTRVVERDRITLDEKKAYAGVRFPLLTLLQAELQAGYAFNRKVYIGEKIFSADRGLSDLASSLYAGWSLKAAF